MRSNKIVIVLALCAFSVAGCKKKKQVQTPPPAPSIAPSTTVAPAQPPQPQPPPAQTTQQQTATATPPKPVKKAKPRPGKRVATQKPASPATSTIAKATPPPRITVEPGSLPDASIGISASAPHSQETDERRTTAQLLQSTEDNLHALTRTLTPDEQATVTRIRSFMSQSQAATKDGDLVRAHNLALKAHLLSDELANR